MVGEHNTWYTISIQKLLIFYKPEEAAFQSQQNINVVLYVVFFLEMFVNEYSGIIVKLSSWHEYTLGEGWQMFGGEVPNFNH